MGYSSAIAYYKRLKERFINWLELQASIQSVKQLNNIENNFIQSLTSLNIGQSFDNLDKELIPILENIIENILNGTKSTEVAQIEQNLKDKINNVNKVSEKIKKQFNDYLITSYDLEKKLKNLPMIRGSGADITDIMNRAQSILLQAVKLGEQNIKNLIQNRKETTVLAGYLHEIAATRATKKFNKILNTIHIGAKNLQSDVVYSGKGINKSRALAQYEDLLTSFDNLSKNFYEGQVNTDEFIALQDFASNIDIYGNQVKSWTMNLEKSRPYGYHVSNQSDLLKSFQNWTADHKINYSQAESINYFEQHAMAIIQTFGINNVLFTTGDGPHFTSDLIEDAYNSSFRLMFEMHKKKLKAGVKLDKIEKANETYAEMS